MRHPVAHRLPIQTFKRGVWIAYVVTRDPRFPDRGYMVRLDHPGGFRTSWPIQYDNGTIAYDWSDVPRDAQRAARAAYRWVSQQAQAQVQLQAQAQLPVCWLAL